MPTTRQPLRTRHRHQQSTLHRSDDATVHEAGFASLELVVLTPVLLLMLLLVVGFGRLTHGRQIADQAAAAAARAAALASDPIHAQDDGQQQAHQILTQAGISCHSFTATVDTSDFGPGGQVTVHVVCVTSLANLGLIGFPGAKTLTASASAPLEQLRDFGPQ